MSTECGQSRLEENCYFGECLQKCGLHPVGQTTHRAEGGKVAVCSEVCRNSFCLFSLVVPVPPESHLLVEVELTTTWKKELFEISPLSTAGTSTFAVH